MFLPVKPDFRLTRFPILTITVCMICVLVFSSQLSAQFEYDEAVSRYCEKPRSRIEQMVLGEIASLHQLAFCDDIPFILMHAEDEAETLDQLIGGLRPLAGFDAIDSHEYVSQMLKEEVRDYRRSVPPDPNDGLAYYSDSWNPVTMITSAFAHGGWGHIIFNLVFFVAFGLTVEMLIGRTPFIAVILLIALINGVFTSLSAMGTGVAVSSVGLSGVVMGMIGLSAWLLPRGRIRCYYWFIVVFGSVAVPIWVLAAWYIGGDLYALFAFDDHGAINIMAHVTGGIAGYLFGMVFLRQARQRAQGMQMTIDRAELKPRFF